jgi:hypothetical protein
VCNKRQKLLRCFPDISKITERRLKMIVMHDGEAKCPYCEVRNSHSNEG